MTAIMATNVFTDAIEKLRSCATVGVEMDARPSPMRTTISISRTKMNEMVRSYALMYRLAHQCWSNLPEAPCDEKTYVFMWMMAADDYEVNHGTIAWEGSNANTFVHLWSIIDRMRIPLENAKMNWVIGTRNCASYCDTTGMTGPLDAHMYPPEYTTPTQITSIDDNPMPMTYKNVTEEFCSFYDFNASNITIPPEIVITASDMERINNEFIRSTRPSASSRTGPRS